MKARLEKKLSKRLLKTQNKNFRGAWIDKEISLLAEEQGTRVSHIPSIGGGLDYWGEANEAYTLWGFYSQNWYWMGNFPMHPEGHPEQYYPDTSGFKPTTLNLLKLIKESNQ